MRIIRAANDARGCATRRALASTMLNIEHGARVVSDTGEQLKQRLPGFNSVTVTPLTDDAPDLTYQIRPTVGIVFYAPCPGFDGRELLEEMATMLEDHGHSHLSQSHRVIEATPSLLLYHHGRVDEDSKIVDYPRRAYSKRHEASTYPARMFIEARPEDDELPTYISHRAAFTWVFMNVAPIVDVVEVSSMKVFNAQIASVVYDAATVLALADRTVCFSLSSSTDLCIPPLAADLREAINTLKGLPSHKRIAILADPEEEKELVLLRAAEHVLCWAGHRTALGDYPLLQGQTENHRVDCFVCEMPVWGEYFVVRGLRWPNRKGKAGIDGDLDRTELKAGEVIIPDNEPFYACRYCFQRFPACFGQHFAGAQIARAHSGLSQAQALEGDARYQKLIPLLQAGPPAIVKEGGIRVGRSFLLLAMSEYPKEMDILRDPDLITLKLPPVCYDEVIVSERD